MPYVHDLAWCITLRYIAPPAIPRCWELGSGGTATASRKEDLVQKWWVHGPAAKSNLELGGI